MLKVLDACQQSLLKGGIVDRLAPRQPPMRKQTCLFRASVGFCRRRAPRSGTGHKIWHFSHVMKGARLGESCVMGQNVNIDGGTVIGNNVKIQNNVSIYTGAVIEDDVFPRPLVCADEREQSAVAGQPS